MQRLLLSTCVAGLVAASSLLAQERATPQNVQPYPATGIFMTSVNYPQVYGYYVYRPGGVVYGPPLANNLMERFPAATGQNEALPIRVEVNCPPEADIWFNGARTRQTGTFRTFVSPAMAPGRTYTYEVRARWEEHGKPMSWRREYEVAAGDRLVVDVGSQAEAGPATGMPTQPTMRSQSLPEVLRKR